MSRGTVSVVIPVRDGAAFIGEAIASARRQTRPPMEIIVVDDGSTDETAAVVRAIPGVRYLHQVNRGPAAARNAAIALAGGDYVAPLDADDLWPEERLELLAARLDAEPDLGVVLGRQTLLADGHAAMPGWVPGTASGVRPTAADPAPGDLPHPTGAFLARRSLFDRVGGYAEDLRHGEDTDWVLRVREAGVRVALVDDVVLVRRLHQDNLTLDEAGQRRAMFEVLQRRIARRRAEADSPADAP